MNDYQKQQAAMNISAGGAAGGQTIGASSQPRIAIELDINGSRLDILAEGLERLCHRLGPVMASNPLNMEKPKAAAIPMPMQSEFASAISYRTDRINDQINLVHAILEQLEV